MLAGYYGIHRFENRRDVAWPTRIVYMGLVGAGTLVMLAGAAVAVVSVIVWLNP